MGLLLESNVYDLRITGDQSRQSDPSGRRNSGGIGLGHRGVKGRIRSFCVRVSYRRIRCRTMSITPCMTKPKEAYSSQYVFDEIVPNRFDRAVSRRPSLVSGWLRYLAL